MSERHDDAIRLDEERYPTRPSGRFARLKRRRLVQWLLGYIAAAAMALQVMDPLRDVWRWPMGFQRAFTLVLAFGILHALVLAWFHGEKGRQDLCLLEIFLLGVATFASVTGIWAVCK